MWLTRHVTGKAMVVLYDEFKGLKSRIKGESHILGKDIFKYCQFRLDGLQ